MKTMMMLACALVLGTGCAAARVESRLPPVQKLESWKDRFHGWSRGVEFPVTVVVTASEGALPFRAYGVDPDRQKILFVADGSPSEHLKDFSGDPLWGTVVLIDARMLTRAERPLRPEETPASRLQQALDLARTAHLPKLDPAAVARK